MKKYCRITLSYSGTLEPKQRKALYEFIRRYNSSMELDDNKKEIKIFLTSSLENLTKEQIKKELKGLEIESFL